MKNENKTVREKVHDIAMVNSIDYNYAKLAEECIELADVLIKMGTKPNRREEKIPHLIEELGDVQLRMAVLIDYLGIASDVQKRSEKKLDNLSDSLADMKYVNY